MFDPSEKVKPEPTPEPEPKRSLGHTQASFGAKITKSGYTIDGKDERYRPNRHDRRALSANARAVPKIANTHQSKAQIKRQAGVRAEKKNLQRMVKAHSPSQQLRRPYYTYTLQYFTPEDIIKLKEEPQEVQDKVHRQILNAFKRRRKILGY